MSEIEETLNRIRTHKGVLGVIVLDGAGSPIKSTFSDEETMEYAHPITQLAGKARGLVKELDVTNDLTFLRIRSKKNEILIAPDKEYLLVVVQESRAETNPLPFKT